MSDSTLLPPSSPARSRPTFVRELLRTLNRRKWLLLGTSLLLPLAAAAVLFLLTPEYIATSRVTVGSGSSLNLKVNDVKAAIESTVFLEKVIDKLNLNQDLEFAFTPVPAFDNPWIWVKTRFLELFDEREPTVSVSQPDQDRRYMSVAGALRRRTYIATQVDSNLLAISVRSVEPTKAKRLANTIASQCAEDAVASARDEDKRVASQLSRQLTTLQQEADAAAQTIKTFREQSGLLSDTDAKAASRLLTDLGSQLTQVQAQVLDRQSRLSILRRTQAGPDTTATDLLTNPVVAALRIQESDASRHLVEVSQRYGENHPRVAAARAELALVRLTITTEIKKISLTQDAELAAALAREKALQEKITTLEQRVRSSEQKGIELRQLERAAERDDTAYRELLRHVREIKESQRESNGAVRVFSLASLPESPSYPRYVETVLIALMFGALIGFFGVWILELFDSGFRAGEQVERLTGRPLMGMIPALSRATLKNSMPTKYVVEKPISAYAEALRSVQTSISLSSKHPQPKVIMITSSVPGEGKSTFSCSLAQLVARSNPGKKIIIVDCDLRRPAVLKQLGQPKGRGTIDEYLSGAKNLDMVIGRDDGSGLYYVPARVDTMNSAELLASPKMRILIDALANEFDLVLLDTPPLMAVADPRVVALLAGYIIFLIQWEKTDRDLATAALKILADRPNVGVVLSQVDVNRHARYGYADHGTYYSKYSSYYLNS